MRLCPQWDPWLNFSVQREIEHGLLSSLVCSEWKLSLVVPRAAEGKHDVLQDVWGEHGSALLTGGVGHLTSTPLPDACAQALAAHLWPGARAASDCIFPQWIHFMQWKGFAKKWRHITRINEIDAADMLAHAPPTPFHTTRGTGSSTASTQRWGTLKKSWSDLKLFWRLIFHAKGLLLPSWTSAQIENSSQAIGLIDDLSVSINALYANNQMWVFSLVNKGGTGGVYQRELQQRGSGCVAADDEVIIVAKGSEWENMKGWIRKLGGWNDKQKHGRQGRGSSDLCCILHQNQKKDRERERWALMKTNPKLIQTEVERIIADTETIKQQDGL